MGDTYKLVDGNDKEIEVKAFSVNIEPMYIGEKKEKRLETIVSVKIYDPAKETYQEFQGIVPPKSRLDQEVKKLLKLKS